MKKFYTLIISCVVLLASCESDKLDYVDNSRIHGALQYRDAATEDVRPVPPGTSVNVVYLGDGNAPVQAFQTLEAGKFTFSPQVAGTYALRFTFEDTIRQFNAALVEKQDVDTTRMDAGSGIRYTGEIASVKVEESNRFYAHDITLQATSVTGFKLMVTDEQGNPLRDVRVCLYANKAFADQNAPFCGGSLAYLSTNDKGEVFFAGLEPKVYFINARGKVGVVDVGNTWSEEMRVSPALIAGQVVRGRVVLK